jgi:hypothetical protein
MSLVNKKHYYSLLCILILAYLLIRTMYMYPKWSWGEHGGSEAVLSWDVFGYYLYLPSHFIYHDLGHLNFIPALFEKYAPAGDFHHAVLQPDGKYVIKYAIGLSLLYLPFFMIAHAWAHIGGYPPDGLSYPYQFCIGIGSVLVAILGLFILRKVLLKYFNDVTVCITLAVLVLGTNYFEYATFSAAMTHGYLFTLYAIVILLTIHWHEKPKAWKAALMGMIIGLITITRPTDCIIALVPLLWGVSNKTELINKLNTLIRYKWHLILFAACGFIGILPQLIYWKIYSGQFIYYSYGDYGFSFLRPHIINGLISYKKGWLVYTPMMLFSIIGFYMLYRKHKAFFYPVLFFLLLNIYLVYSWDVWWYGGGLGSRAMVESYALLALPLASFISYITTAKRYLKVLVFMIILWFVEINLFQHWQAHAQNGGWQAEMTRAYFWRVFNNSRVTMEDQKFLDVNEDRDTSDFRQSLLLSNDYETDTSQKSSQHACSGKYSVKLDRQNQYSPDLIFKLSSCVIKPGSWIRVSSNIFFTDKEWYMWNMAQLVVGVQKKDGSFKSQIMRLQRLTDPWQCYHAYFDFKLPDDLSKDDLLKAYVWNADGQKEIYIDDLQIKLLEPKD